MKIQNIFWARKGETSNLEGEVFVNITNADNDMTQKDGEWLGLEIRKLVLELEKMQQAKLKENQK